MRIEEEAGERRGWLMVRETRFGILIEVTVGMRTLEDRTGVSTSKIFEDLGRTVVGCTWKSVFNSAIPGWLVRLNSHVI